MSENRTPGYASSRMRSRVFCRLGLGTTAAGDRFRCDMNATWRRCHGQEQTGLIMSERRSTKRKTRQFTLDDLRQNRSRVVRAAKKDGGCIVVDKNGQRLFTLCIPQGPVDNAD